MRALGNYILLGHPQAVAVVGLFTLFSLFVPQFSYLLSGVPAGLVILRKGSAYGMRTLLICLLGLVLFFTGSGIDPQMAFLFAFIVWVPVILCCSVLRMTRSQGWLVFCAGMTGVFYMLVLHWWAGDDISAWWRQQVELLPEGAFSGGRDQYVALFQAAAIINVVIGTVATISFIITTLLSRWWQSILFNPGGFRAEFYALRLPRAVILFLPLTGVAVLADGEQYGWSVLFILVVMYLFQGLASVHRIVNRNKLSLVYLVVMYFLLVFMSEAILIVAGLGLVDSLIHKDK